MMAWSLNYAADPKRCTYGGIEWWLVGAEGREVGGHALGVRGGVHGQGRDAGRGQSLVAEQVVLARADRLSGERVGVYRPAGVAAPGRRRGRSGRGGGGRADRGYGRGRVSADGRRGRGRRDGRRRARAGGQPGRRRGRR